MTVVLNNDMDVDLVDIPKTILNHSTSFFKAAAPASSVAASPSPPNLSSDSTAVIDRGIAPASPTVLRSPTVIGSVAASAPIHSSLSSLVATTGQSPVSGSSHSMSKNNKMQVDPTAAEQQQQEEASPRHSPHAESTDPNQAVPDDQSKRDRSASPSRLSRSRSRSRSHRRSRSPSHPRQNPFPSSPDNDKYEKKYSDEDLQRIFNERFMSAPDDKQLQEMRDHAYAAALAIEEARNKSAPASVLRQGGKPSSSSISAKDLGKQAPSKSNIQSKDFEHEGFQEDSDTEVQLIDKPQTKKKSGKKSAAVQKRVQKPRTSKSKSKCPQCDLFFEKNDLTKHIKTAHRRAAAKPRRASVTSQSTEAADDDDDDDIEEDDEDYEEETAQSKAPPSPTSKPKASSSRTSQSPLMYCHNGKFCTHKEGPDHGFRRSQYNSHVVACDAHFNKLMKERKQREQTMEAVSSTPSTSAASSSTPAKSSSAKRSASPGATASGERQSLLGQHQQENTSVQHVIETIAESLTPPKSKAAKIAEELDDHCQQYYGINFAELPLKQLKHMEQMDKNLGKKVSYIRQHNARLLPSSDPTRKRSKASAHRHTTTSSSNEDSSTSSSSSSSDDQSPSPQRSKKHSSRKSRPGKKGQITAYNYYRSFVKSSMADHEIRSSWDRLKRKDRARYMHLKDVVATYNAMQVSQLPQHALISITHVLTNYVRFVYCMCVCYVGAGTKKRWPVQCSIVRTPRHIHDSFSLESVGTSPPTGGTPSHMGTHRFVVFRIDQSAALPNPSNAQHT